MTGPATTDGHADAPDTADTGTLSQFLPYQLSIASNAVSSVIAERYRKRFGLKVPEWRVMAVLGDTGLGGTGLGDRGLGDRGLDDAGQADPARRVRLTQRDLAAATLMDKVAVNRACKVLEERGLVARVQNDNDGRSHLLELTGEGQAIHAEVMPLARATERDLFAGFDNAEKEALRAMLQRLRSRAGDLIGGNPGS